MSLQLGVVQYEFCLCVYSLCIARPGWSRLNDRHSFDFDDIASQTIVFFVGQQNIQCRAMVSSAGIDVESFSLVRACRVEPSESSRRDAAVRRCQDFQTYPVSCTAHFATDHF